MTEGNDMKNTHDAQPQPLSRKHIEEMRDSGNTAYVYDSDTWQSLCNMALESLPSETGATGRLPQFPEWDGWVRFDSDCVVNGVEVKAGTSWGPFQKSQNISAASPSATGATRRQIVFNWLTDEDGWETRQDGAWGGPDEVARVDALLAALDAAPCVRVEVAATDPMQNWLMKGALEWLEQAEHGGENERCKVIAGMLRSLWRGDKNHLNAVVSPDAPDGDSQP